MKTNHSSKRSPRRLIALVASAVGLLMAAPAAANALTVYAASSLREAFPKMAPGNTYNFSGSNELRAADRTRRTGGRVRLGRAGRGAGPLPGGALHPSGHLRDQHRRVAGPERQPGQHQIGLQPAQRQPHAGRRHAGGADRLLHPPVSSPVCA